MKKVKSEQRVVDAVEVDPEVNVDSLWLIGPRAKGGKRENNYHGNFVPQIPNDLIRRFTNREDVVIEPFMGSGTTLFECERLFRRYVGFDINSDIVDFVRGKMNGRFNDYAIHLYDAASDRAGAMLRGDLKRFGRDAADLMILHPPYFNIIKFSDKQYDLSNAKTLEEYFSMYRAVVNRQLPFVRRNGHLAVVAGDLYRNSEVVPLGFMIMNATLQDNPLKLKGIIVKDMVGNRAKIGLDALWRKRALRSDYYLFKHEYVFVFRKIK